MTRPPLLPTFAILFPLTIASFGLAIPALARAQEEAVENGEQEGAKTESSEADEAKPADQPDAPEVVKLDGIFQAVHADTIRIQVEEWSSLTVAEAAEHGTKVQAGDVLIKLETDKLERAIDDTEHELMSDELALIDAEVKLQLARRSQDLALKAAAAADRTATEDLKDFIAVGRSQRMTGFDRSVLSARNRLEYQAEELKQLEQMYSADDLTEETEEIILKRTRDAVESAKYSLDMVMDSQRKGLEFDLPRSEEQLEQAMARASLALEEARRTAPQSLKRQELEFEKQKRDLKTKKERLERLRADLKQLVITAPRSGVVYYGVPRRGKWSDPASLESMLQPGGTPKARTGLMTVVELRPMTVQVSVPEASLRHAQPGTAVTIEPVAYPDHKVKGRFVERSAIPIASGQFDAVVELDETTLTAELVPGMSAKVIIEAKPEAKN